LTSSLPLVQAETGATMRVCQDDAGAAGVGPIPPLCPWGLGVTDHPLEAARSCRTTTARPGRLIGGVGHRAPVGVVSCITSYNFPVVNMAGKIGPALAMGNTVVVKPAPQDPLGVIKLVES
jgi:phenylacetaldehyde dehydrogenase